jgi:CRP/FNR family transcriptional regulator, cyclic AMP receptor protein
VSDAELVAAVGRCTLFAGLKPAVQQQIADAGNRVQHPAGKVLAEEGTDGVGFHIVLSGAADVTVAGTYRRTLGPGEYFGEVSLIDGGPRSAGVTAGRDGLQTFALASWAFRPILESQPEVAQALLLGLCSRLRDAEAAARG